MTRTDSAPTVVNVDDEANAKVRDLGMVRVQRGTARYSGYSE